MTVSIKLTDRQFVRLQRIRKDFIDRELDRVEDQLFSKIRGRVVGRWEDVE